MSLLDSGPLGGSKEFWDKGAPCSLIHTFLGPTFFFFFFFFFFIFLNL